MLPRHALMAGLLAALCSGQPAFAQDDRLSRGVVVQLEQQGFEVREASRTLLGRIRIVADREGLRRELVIDPRNGAILRDFVSGQRGEDDDGPDIPEIGDYDDDRDDDRGDDDDGDDDDGGDDE